MKTITTIELRSKLEREKGSLKLVNSLDPYWFNQLHIPGSINIHQIEEVYKWLDKKDEIILYCTNELCFRSRFLYNYLEHLSFKNVRHYPGGLEAWSAQGLPMAGSMAGSLNAAA